ncbi:phage holin family protein [Streptomyces sp. WMMC500]|uniref:phage holin family protein n=1 Tax=Streptomyces sp. WMMC500 TaxID=3015154 RepID=UPI00248BC86A|nr:phage holin family protein [Streptomyces sp. WMMC500]WBB62098.1 phage holin family protein [Streptomyces sp. WMMC500]
MAEPRKAPGEGTGQGEEPGSGEDAGEGTGPGPDARSGPPHAGERTDADARFRTEWDRADRTEPDREDRTEPEPGPDPDPDPRAGLTALRAATTRKGRRAAARGLGRIVVVWAVGTVTMLILAGALPDFRLQSPDGDSATRIAVTAAVGAGVFGVLSALVWPVLVRALLLVPAFVLGLLVFFLNGSLLLIALSLNPTGSGEANPETAVVVAAVMSAASSATSTALTVRDDGAYRRRLARLAYRRGAPAVSPDAAPGIVFLQLDGVGHDVLHDALQERERAGGRSLGGQRLLAHRLPPVMETVASWHGTSHRLIPWRTDWSSQTGASQLGILHGTNEDVPAFRWYEKETGEVKVCSHPSTALELERRAAARAASDPAVPGGLLATGAPGDTASRGNLFTGGATQLALVLSVAVRRKKKTRSRAGYFAYFSDPANASRTFASFVAEAGREVFQSLRSRLRRETPRVGRGGLYPFIRAFATVVSRDVVVAAVIGDMLAGRTAVYADLVAYDEVAHYTGPHHRDAQQVLRRIDRSIALVAKAAEHAPRPYRIVLLSDHGQSHGPTFADTYGLTLQDLVRAGCGLPVSRRAGRTRSGAEARTAARAALRRPERSEDVHDGRERRGLEPVVLGSGNLGLVSFPELPGVAGRETIERRHPALLPALTEHPGVGFVLVRSEEHGPVVLGADGAEHHLETGKVIGIDPLLPFGPGAAETVLRTARFRHAPDIMVNSSYDPATGTVHAFEDQIGSHGGLGGEQSRAFLFWPEGLTPPVPAGETLAGAESVHRVLRRWIGECGGPVVRRAAAEVRADQVAGSRQAG